MEKSRIYTEAEIEQLFLLCSDAKVEDTDSWNPVRNWLKNNRNNEKLVTAAVNNQEEGETPLHLILRKCPPVDIVREMIEIAPNLLRLPNSHGLLPLHIACKHSASVEVVDKLINGAPITVRIGDSFSWLPIHFACANPEASIDIVNRLLRDANDTVRFKNNNAQLPIHLACMFGASFEVISRLLKDAPDAVQDEDYLSRTPILLAGSYGAYQSVIDLLNEVSTEVNAKQKHEAEIAIQELKLLLAEWEGVKNEELWKNIRDWIQKYRHNDLIVVPQEFFERIWTLPKILRNMAIQEEFVKKMLNASFSERGSIIYVMLDIYCSFFMIPLSFEFFENYVTYLFKADKYIDQNAAAFFFFIFCGCYQCFRGLTRLAHVLFRDSIGSLATSPLEHWHHLITSVILFSWIGVHWSWTPETLTTSQKELFRGGSAICCGMLCLEAWIVLTYASLKFAITSNGVAHVLTRITYFLFVLWFVIVTFSFMFTLVYSTTNICEDPADFAFCRFGTSMMELYSYLYGSVDYTYFYSSRSGLQLDPSRQGNFAVGFYMVYMFLVAILFLNLLVAIIVDSYTTVGQQAETSFWTQRMLFILDVNQMQKFFNRISRIIGLKSKSSPLEDNRSDEMSSIDSFASYWKKTLFVFHDKRLDNQNGEMASNYWTLLIRRCACIIFILTWLLLGIVSAGYLWPPQVRIWLFFAKAEKEKDSEKPLEDTTSSMKQLQTEIFTANQIIYTRFGTTEASIKDMNTKIDQLAFEMQRLKSVNEVTRKMDSSYKKSETQEIKTELEDIKKILLSLSKKSLPREG